MTSYSKIKSYAKINLALNVVGKNSLIHKIESIISFVNLYDEILIRIINDKNHKIKFIGKFSEGISANNTINKLLSIIEKKKILRDKKFQIIIKKNIPLEAGLGGGSMNAASILKFLIKKKIISLSKKEITNICNLIGSDVIIGMYTDNLVLKSNKRIKKFLIKKKTFALLVKPTFGCATKKIYAKIKHFRKAKFNQPSKRMFKLNFLKKMSNDLEPVVLNKFPKFNTLKTFLEKLSNVEFVRMTGSGSVIIAYFKTYKVCKEAEKKVKNYFKNYWCKIVKTI